MIETPSGMDVFAQAEKPGLVYDLDERTYHSGRNSLSVSGAKLLLPPSCPAKFKWHMDNPIHKDVFDVGSAAHKRVLGVGADIEVIQKLTIKKEVVDADTRDTVSAQKHIDEIRKAGKTPLLRKEVAMVEAMASALKDCREAAPFLSGNGQAEVSGYFEDEMTGVIRRCRFDWLPNRDGSRLVLADYKTADSADPVLWAKAAANWSYEMQAAWYLDAAKALGLDDDPAFVFIVQEKSPPYLTAVYQLDADAITVGRYRNRQALELYAECLRTDFWPGRYANLQLPLPAWHINEHEKALA